MILLALSYPCHYLTRYPKRGVPQYDFYEFATILQVATIIFYYLILFLLILTCTPEQYTCASTNTLPTTFHRNIRKTL